MPALDSLRVVDASEGIPGAYDYFKEEIQRWVQKEESTEQRTLMLDALQEFIVRPSGTDQQRLQAAQVLAEAGRLPRGELLKTWLGGKLDETMILAYEISSEPMPPLPGPIQRRFEKAQMLM